MDSQDRFRRLEVQHRRADAAHPDRCLKLRLGGVPFALPPRGTRITPRFDSGGRARLQWSGDDPCDGLADLLRRVAGSLDGSVLKLRRAAAEGVLADLITLARRALLRQYDLDDTQLAELLSVASDEPPVWIADLLRWVQGFPAAAFASEPPRRERRWWPFGGRRAARIHP